MREAAANITNLNGWAMAFLFLIGIALPALAIRTNQRLAGRELPLPRAMFYWQTIFFQLFVYASALVAAATNGVRLRLLPGQPLRAASALLLLGVALAVLRLRWPHRTAESKRRLIRLLPAGRADVPPYLLLCLVAGVAEEVAYRGTGYRLLLIAGLNLYAAAAVMAIVFALSHMVQGWSSVGVILLFAAAFHFIVIYTNSLLPAIIAHIAYDVIAGLLVPKWAMKHEG